MPLPCRRSLAGLALFWATLGGAWAQSSLSLVEPAHFTDVRELRDLQHDLQQPLQALLQRLSAQYLPAGHSLEVALLDVDLAGDVEPVGPMMQPVRILRPTSPPRLQLRFTLRDATGQIVSLGEAHLTDLDYLHRAGPPAREGVLPSEQALLTDWFLQTWAPAAR